MQRGTLATSLVLPLPPGVPDLLETLANKAERCLLELWETTVLQVLVR